MTEDILFILVLIVGGAMIAHGTRGLFRTARRWRNIDTKLALERQLGQKLSWEDFEAIDEAVRSGARIPERTNRKGGE